MAQLTVQRSCAKLRSAQAIGYDGTGDMEEMIKVLEAIEPVLEDAEWRSLQEEPARYWLARVRNAACDIEDMVAELQDTRTSAAGMVVSRMHSCFAKNPMADKMKEIKQELSTLQEESRGFDFKALDADVHGVTDVPKGVPEVVEAMIVGRGEEIQRLMAALLYARHMIHDGTIILPIFGLHGVGKTTLAAMAFNDTNFQRRRHFRVWVHCPLRFDLCEIGKSIISQMSKQDIDHGSIAISQESEEESHSRVSGEEIIGHHGSNDDIEYITKRLHELLSDAKDVLVVLDHLWEEDSNQLERLKHMLGVGKNGILAAVIVTTCNESVARNICAVEPFKLNPLSDEECWKIMKQRSGFEDRSESDRQKLELIARGIASKCGGLPLVAHEIGRRLQHEDPKSVQMDCIVRYEIQRLWLSYRCMPQNLRLCFAYYAAVRLLAPMTKDELIHQWIALGILEQSDIFSAIELGEEYIKRLVSMSLFPTADSICRNREMREIYYDLDIMYNFALFLGYDVAADEVYFWPSYREYQTRRYGFFYHGPEVMDAVSLNWEMAPRLRVLIVNFWEETSSYSRFLRVLDFQRTRTSKLPNDIFRLRLLGYLNISGSSKLSYLPELIGNLINLVYIDLSGCPELVNLPESFGKLIKLLHIDLSGCTGLVTLPGSFAKLINLLHIDLSGCTGLVTLPGSFGKLINLLHIDLSGCTGLVTLPGSFVKLENLLHINLSRCLGLAKLPESFGTLVNLVYLDLSFCTCFEGIQKALGGLTSLQHLNLSHPCYYHAQERTHLKELAGILGNFTKLQSLNLSAFLDPIFYYMSEKKILEHIICGLSRLEHLDLSHNRFLFDLPESPGKLNKLHTLDLSGCVRLKEVHSWVVEIDCLKVNNCRCLEFYHFVVRADDSSSNLAELVKRVNYNWLKISCLEKVKSTEEAQRIRLVEKRNLRKLKLCWTVYSQRSVEDNDLLGELQPPHNLQCLELHGFGGQTCLPAWWISSLSSHLSNLEEITLENFPYCSRLPPMGLLPNLQRLVLRKMMSLIEFVFPAIDELVIQECHALRFGPLPPRARRLVISGCHQLMSSSGKTGGGHGAHGPSAPATTELVVESCNVPVADWSLLHHLPGLQSLTIKNCDNPSTSSPEIIRTLSSLQTLRFSHCDSMESLPEQLGDLASLQELQIESCKLFNSFPNCMQHLTSLQSMHFTECENITALPEWFGGLSSLQKLTFQGCPAITSLPRSIQKLTNLKDLHISCCPILAEWCKLEVNKHILAHIPNKTYEYVLSLLQNSTSEMG